LVRDPVGTFQAPDGCRTTATDRQELGQEHLMGLGLGIVLIVLGLILVSGVIEYDISFIEDTTLGWILLLAGVLAIVLGLIMNAQRSRTKHVEERRVDGV
jgi:uncharacterized membrane protein HdeD (DUF308 family)